MKKISTVLLLISSLAAVGCATVAPGPTGFYWSNYSQTLYDYKKNPNATTLAKHKANLEKIIHKCDQTPTYKVPPGIYAELGKIYLDEGKQDLAARYFNLEVATYPESAVLVNTLMEKTES